MFHLRAKIIGRSGGRSAAGATAYRAGSRMATAHMAYVAGEKLTDPASAKTFDYRAKGRIDKNGHGVLFKEVLAPKHAPKWVHDLQKLADAVEKSEKRKDAQLYRELEVSLPRELGLEDWKQLLRVFVERTCVREGMVAAIFIHNERASDGGDNPHAHIMLTMRDIGPDGFGKKRREWNQPGRVAEWREAWAHYANKFLMARGHAPRLDHRSHKERGLDVEPDSYVGPAKSRQFDGIIVEHRQQVRNEAKERNLARAFEDPSWVLEQLSRTQSTFTEYDIARFIHRYTALSNQDHRFNDLYQRVLQSKDLQKLADAGKLGSARYTTRAMFKLEGRMISAAGRLAARFSGSVKMGRKELSGLSEEQQAAAEALVQGADLAALHGLAGSGKSHLLAAVAAAYLRAGRRVRGAALSALVARDLGQGAGIESQTIASLLKDLARAKPFNPLKQGDVLILEEAGMVGSRQMSRILDHAERAGAKVILVGDTRQLQAIEAGGAFKTIVERHGAAELRAIKRQRHGWQQAASKDLAHGKVGEALAVYRAQGCFHAAHEPQQAMEDLIERWLGDRASGHSQLILAHRRSDAQKLNRLARTKLRAEGKLGPDVTISISHLEEKDGELISETSTRQFAAGDRLLFTKNERALGVQNGSVGTVQSISQSGVFKVRLDDGADVVFDHRSYNYIEQGYALTVHKAQGVTVDRTYVLASEMMDAQMAYVALTRHRERVDLYYNRTDFPSDAKLMHMLGRERLKDTSADYAPRRDIALPTVPEWLLCARIENETEVPAMAPSRFLRLKDIENDLGIGE